tara:strand:+ start:148 stop:342 length:195 start_codon:yes stop_codon:yes gene_type:complete
MELLKQKIKTKKYQYLYLEKKIFHKWCEADYDCEIHKTSKFNVDDRSQHLLNWLKKINKKYNYA